MNPRDDITEITMYSTSWCGDCVRAKMFFDKFNISYDEIDIDKDTAGAEKVMKINGGNRSVPTILISFESDPQEVLVEPSYDELGTVLLR